MEVVVRATFLEAQLRGCSADGTMGPARPLPSQTLVCPTSERSVLALHRLLAQLSKAGKGRS